MADIKQLTDDIYTIASGVSGISDVYYGDAPQDSDGTAVVSYPYIVFEILASPRDRDTGNKYPVVKIQFDLLAQSYAVATSKTSSLEAALDVMSSYSMTNFNLLDVWNDWTKGPFSVPSDDNDYLWQVVLQYTYKLQEK